MTAFTIRLAEVPIGVEALFPETKTFCREYLTEEPPAFTLTVSPDDIAEEHRRSRRQMALEGLPLMNFTDAYMETLALYRKITAALLQHNVLLMHGAVLACGGEAYLFTAKSGTGKTTHCNLWLKNIPGCHILNGDKPLLWFKENAVFACGTPWMGKEQCGVNEILPLAGICVLERSTENHIEHVSIAQAYPVLLSQTHRPEGANTLSKVVRLLKNLENVELYRLGCNMQAQAAQVAYAAMAQKQGQEG